MKKIFICIAILLSLTLLTGCGEVYHNVRELEQLMPVQTMGFDSSADGVTLSISTGGDDTPVRMAAQAGTVSLAEQELQDYSAAEEIFYAHTSYIALGEAAAREGLEPWFDFVRRSPQLRLDTPLFVVNGETASTLVLGSGGETFDATSVLRSLERDLKKRGDCTVFSVKDVMAALERDGTALVCAVRCVPASEALYGAEDGLTALPDGYAVIKNEKMVGSVPYADAYAVGLLRGECGACRLELGEAAVQLHSVTVQNDGTALKMELRASLLEKGGMELAEINKALHERVTQSVVNIFDLVEMLDCDFVGLGLPEEITVTTTIDRGFDTDTEA